MHFLTHTAVGSMIFVIIAMSAYGPGELVHWLKASGSSVYVVSVLTLLEYANVGLDAVLLLWHLVATGIAAMKESNK